MVNKPKPDAAKQNAAATTADRATALESATPAAKKTAAKTAPKPPVKSVVKAAEKSPAKSPAAAAPKAASPAPLAPAPKAADSVAAKAETRPVVKTDKTDKSAKPKKAKLVRDSFTMPESEYSLIAAVKKRCITKGVAVKKSEVLRAAVIGFAAQSDAAIAAALRTLEVIKTGRPPKGQK